MKVLRVFFIGMVYGWFMRWIIDKIFLDDNLRILTNENELLRQRIITLEARKASNSNLVQQRTASASLPVEQVQPAAPSTSGLVPPHRDDLKMIKGVGPKLEEKLNEAGVYTFDQMSQLTTTELQAILGVARRNVQNTDNLIKQAKKLSENGPKG